MGFKVLVSKNVPFMAAAGLVLRIMDRNDSQVPIPRLEIAGVIRMPESFRSTVTTLIETPET